jgi:hypothetical protein
MRRKRLVQSGNNRCAAILEEAVLRQVIGDAEIMAGRLGYLLEATAFPTVSVGVIPLGVTGRPVWPLEVFTVFNDTRVYVELLSAPVTITTLSEFHRAGGTEAAIAVAGERRGTQFDPGWWMPDPGSSHARSKCTPSAASMACSCAARNCSSVTPANPLCTSMNFAISNSSPVAGLMGREHSRERRSAACHC